MANRLCIAIGQYSSAGRKELNEDFYGVLIPDDPLLSTKGIAAVIADGMSSSDAGEVASELSVKGFLHDYFSTPESWTVKTSVEKVLSALNRWLYGLGQREYVSPRGLVTTFSAVVIKSTTAHLFHIGDSRIYRLRDNSIECLTQDHRIYVSKRREYLCRALGIDVYVDIDYQTLPVEKGDIFLLTTDGVHDILSDDLLLRKVLTDHYPCLEQTALHIVESALYGGSEDNLTCQILRVDELPKETENELYNKLTNLPFPPDLSPGMILDGYRIVRELHATSHMQIYLAQDTETGQRVVLKTPSVNYEDDPVYINRFVHEEWIGKRLNNPHVMKVHPQTHQRRFLYYVAEYIEGQTLRQWINDHPNPTLSEVRLIVNQIVIGVRAFHRMEMIHQDLKPENIMIDIHGTVKIIDFGSTKIAGLEEIVTPLTSHHLVGTLNYAAVEYFRDQPGSNRSDIFSLGVIAYEMLTGHLPYGKTLSKRALRHLKYTSVRDFNPAVPAWLDAVLKKAVHPEPARRYGHLSEFIYDLSHPNPKLMNRKPRPLLERNAVAFWKGVSISMFLINILILYLLFKITDLTQN